MAPTLHTARLLLTPIGEHDPRRRRTPLQPGTHPLLQGLATEAATAVLADAVEVLALPEILATTDDANTTSIRTLTRLGATPMPRIQVGPHTCPCYRLHPNHPGMLL